MDQREEHIAELRREIATAKQLKDQLQREIDRLDQILRAAKASGASESESEGQQQNREDSIPPYAG